MPIPAPPLILTAAVDEQSQAYFNALRSRYFPKHCNYLDAHITLFHRLPSDAVLVDTVLKDTIQRAGFEMKVEGVKHIGNGVAFSICSKELQEIHRSMQVSFHDLLISQDRQKLWPHITVQNKVTAFKSKTTAEELQAGFEPFTIKCVGISSWLYMKGPWGKLDDFLFI